MNKTPLYKMFIDMKNEIDRHKWIESEKNHCDIGFEKALIDWIDKHRLGWVNSYTINDKEKR